MPKPLQLHQLLESWSTTSMESPLMRNTTLSGRGKGCSDSIQPGLADGETPNIWDNHLSPSRPQPSVTSTSRRPHPDIRNQRFRCKADLSWSRQLSRPVTDVCIQADGIAIENPGRILLGFNGASTTSLGDIILPVQAGPMVLNVWFSIVEYLSPFNAIMGRMWLHDIKVIPSTYHQIVSYLTEDAQVKLFESQLAAWQCYQVERESGSVSVAEPFTEPTSMEEQ